MSRFIKHYASRDSMVGICKWDGSDDCYGVLKGWIGNEVQRDSEGSIFLQSEDGIDIVGGGDYILKVGDNFVSLNKDELDDSYVLVVGQE